MIDYEKLYPIWILGVIHSICFIQVLYICVFRNKNRRAYEITTKESEKLDSPVSDIDYPFKRFPRLDTKIFFTCIKRNHVFSKLYYRIFSTCESFSETLRQVILLTGLLGISGTLINFWTSASKNTIGVISGIFARLFHFSYTSLQATQETLIIALESNDKVAAATEAEVIRRLNKHRVVRRVFGYSFALLYYATNVYYTVKFYLKFNSDFIFNWFIAYLIGLATIVIFLENFKIILQLEAIDYLKNSYNDGPKEFLRAFVGKEFVSTFK